MLHHQSIYVTLRKCHRVVPTWSHNRAATVNFRIIGLDGRLPLLCEAEKKPKQGRHDE